MNEWMNDCLKPEPSVHLSDCNSLVQRLLLGLGVLTSQLRCYVHSIVCHTCVGLHFDMPLIKRILIDWLTFDWDFDILQLFLFHGTMHNFLLTYLLHCVGGVFAGMVSDYLGGRALTCMVMLLVAAPSVSCNSLISNDVALPVDWVCTRSN